MTFYAQAGHARRARDIDIPIPVLREALAYDPVTGILRWRPKLGERPGVKSWNTKYAGTPAGWPTTLGYFFFRFTFNGKSYGVACHRAAWALMTGAWPLAEIDHRDGIRSNNRWTNLREATHAQNAQNRKLDKRNSSGFCGVHWEKRARQWEASIRVLGRLHKLGLFATPEEARDAYLSAKARFHTFQPAPRAA